MPEAMRDGFEQAAPRVLLIGDEEAGGDLAGAIARAGGRAMVARSEEDFAEATAVVARIAAEIDAADALLARIEEMARARGMPALLLIPHAAIDPVVAAVSDPHVGILVEPGAEELAAALANLLAPVAAGVRDPAGEQGRELERLSEEAARIARALARLAQDEPAPGTATASELSEQAAIARLLLRLRRMRGQFFRPSPFADPAWDILLDLTVARADGHPVAVSSLCIAAGVPATTALRWIAMLTDRGLLARAPDPADRRRMFVTLTEAAAAAMAGYCAAAAGLLIQR